jgi:hypothetical protein
MKRRNKMLAVTAAVPLTAGAEPASADRRETPKETVRNP